MKINITADVFRGFYADFLERWECSPELTDAPRADGLTADQLAEMVEDFEWRTESRDRFDILAVSESVISDWINDYLYNLDHN